MQQVKGVSCVCFLYVTVEAPISKVLLEVDALTLRPFSPKQSGVGPPDREQNIVYDTDCVFEMGP